MSTKSSYVSFGNCATAMGDSRFFTWSMLRAYQLYIDSGLSVLKLGDEARVPLETFTVDRGGLAAELRHFHDSVAAQGALFEMVHSNQVPALLPELKRVSDDWLIVTNTRERGFSMGFFDLEYVVNFPCALVRKERRIVAFAILWASPNQEELALDLMRYHHEAPRE